MNNSITLRNGFYFPKPVLYLGYVCIIIGIISLFENVYKGIGITALGCFFSFTPCGIQLNAKDQLYRNYVSILAIKTGKWKSLKSFRFITIVRTNISETTYGASTPVSITTSEKAYNICLLTDTHQEKLIVKRCKDPDKAKALLNDLSDKLGMEILL